jgi:hypothetical protein
LKVESSEKTKPWAGAGRNSLKHGGFVRAATLFVLWVIGLTKNGLT